MDSPCSHPGPPPVWSFRDRAAALFFIVFLALQVLVPTIRLAGPKPQRFGWQMFSAVRVPPRVSVVMEDGTEQVIPIQDLLGHPRDDLTYEGFLPRHLCETVPGILAVKVDRGDGSPPEVHTCR